VDTIEQIHTEMPQENWPTEEDFNSKKEILKRRDLPLGIYKIEELEDKKKSGLSP